MDHFVTILALIGIVVVVASLMSGALERSGSHHGEHSGRVLTVRA